MNDVVHVTSGEDIRRLQAEMVKMPQCVEHVTRHYFADGMYCRELWRPAGCLIVGKVHRKEHFYIVARGEVTVTWDGRAPERVVGPKVFVSPVGTKRAVLAHTDATCITVHRCSERDLEKIERELVEDDPHSPFQVGNELKEGVCPSLPPQ